jgi:hypothetical protein
MRIESKFFSQLRTQLRDELENGLGIHDETEGMKNHIALFISTSLTFVLGHNNAIRLLAEDPKREEQRQGLLAKRKALLQGQQILKDLKQKSYDRNASSQDFSTGTVHEVGESSPDLHTANLEEMDEM